MSTTENTNSPALRGSALIENMLNNPDEPRDAGQEELLEVLSRALADREHIRREIIHLTKKITRSAEDIATRVTAGFDPGADFVAGDAAKLTEALILDKASIQTILGLVAALRASDIILTLEDLA